MAMPNSEHDVQAGIMKSVSGTKNSNSSLFTGMITIQDVIVAQLTDCNSPHTRVIVAQLTDCNSPHFFAALVLQI